MTIEEAFAVMSQGPLEPLYVLNGSNSYWGARWLHEVRQRFLGAGQDTGYVRVEGAADFRTIQLELATGGFFGDRKLVVVSNGRWNKKEEKLAQYLNHPIANTLLVLFEEKGSASLEKAIGSQCIIELKPLSAAAFRRFVQDEAHAHSIVFDEQGFDEFCVRMAGNEYHTVTELDKMAILPEPRWTRERVREWVLPMPSEEPLWDVTDALLRREMSSAVQLTERHLSRGVAPLLLFIMLVRQVIQVDRAQRAQAANLPLSVFQQTAGLKEWAAKKVWAASRSWPEYTVELMLKWARRIDVAMKTGYGEAEVWLVMWLNLMGPKKTPPVKNAGGERTSINWRIS